MAQVHFTSHLRHVAPPEPLAAEGGTVREVLSGVFGRYPALRGYILDDQDRLRLHIAVFLDGVHLRKDILDHAVRSESELYVLQALSGG